MNTSEAFRLLRMHRSVPNLFVSCKAMIRRKNQEAGFDILYVFVRMLPTRAGQIAAAGNISAAARRHRRNTCPAPRVPRTLSLHNGKKAGIRIQ